MPLARASRTNNPLGSTYSVGTQRRSISRRNCIFFAGEGAVVGEFGAEAGGIERGLFLFKVALVFRQHVAGGLQAERGRLGFWRRRR